MRSPDAPAAFSTQTSPEESIAIPLGASSWPPFSAEEPNVRRCSPAVPNSCTRLLPTSVT